MALCALLLLFANFELPGVSQHLVLWADVPLDPSLSLRHYLSVMHETGRSKMEAFSAFTKPFGTTNVLILTATASKWCPK